MNNPDLIQRCILKKDVKKSDIKGIDSVFSMDYMGSAEFEFGALPASLREVTSGLKRFKIFKTNWKTPAGEGLFLYCPEENRDAVIQAIQSIIDGKARLKENARINKALDGGDKEDYRRIVMWWDILNHWFVCVGKDTAYLLEIALATLRDRWLQEGKINA